MGIPTFLLDAATAAGIDAPALAGPTTEVPAMTTTLPTTDAAIAKLARKTLKGDVTAAATAIVTLQNGTLTSLQRELLRVSVSFALGGDPATEEKGPRQTRENNPKIALSVRAKDVSISGDRARNGMRAKKLFDMDPTALTLDGVKALTDEQVKDLVAAPIREGDTVADILELAQLVRDETAETADA